MKTKTELLITSLIKPKSRVLDLGCGDGKLLAKLKHKKSIQGYGIEWNKNNILSCIEHKIPVFQGDIEDILSDFQTDSYDYVILSETLQETKNTVNVLNESIRIGKQVIITFPNFGYWKIRLQLLKGKTPETSLLPYKWYETPNIRVLTISDFKKVCNENKIKIKKELNIEPLLFCKKNACSNLLSKQGIFIVSR